MIAPGPSGLAALEASLRRDLSLLNHPPPAWVPPRARPDGSPVRSVVVVGAGMCGLAAAFALQRRGIADVLVLDKGEAGLEGPWVTFARMTTLRSPKQLVGPALGFASLTFRAWFEAQFGTAGWAALDKIPRQQWMDYLVWYRRALDLPVRNRVAVTHIAGEDGLVRLDILEDGVPGCIHAREVVLATGRDGLGGPTVPAFASALPARLAMHSADPIDFAALRGKRVGVIGVGASAVDNAATALEAGAAEVRMLARRRDIPRINKLTGVSSPGLTAGYPLLDDAWRWRFMHYTLSCQVPPPRDSMLRMTRHAGFHLHLGHVTRTMREAGDAVEVETDRARFLFDFVILGTGFDFDIAKRPELAGIAGRILLWRDRFTPPADQASAELGRAPYLGPAFEFLEKMPGTAPELAHLHCFNYAAMLSHGKVSGDIPAISDGAVRLAESIAAALFVEDREHHFAELVAYAKPELLGDEWRDADAAPPDRTVAGQ